MSVICTSQVHAGLIFTIDSYTSSALQFSISGTFDADTTGDLPGYLAIKNDWSNNVGVHTELFGGALNPSIVTNTISIGGVAPPTFAQNGSLEFLDSLFFRNVAGEGVAFTAGTTVTGSVTLLGAFGTFDPADGATLQLVSGRNDASGTNDWVRWEGGAALSAAVPEPSSLALLGLGGFSMACGAIRRRKKKLHNKKV